MSETGRLGLAGQVLAEGLLGLLHLGGSLHLGLLHCAGLGLGLLHSHRLVYTVYSLVQVHNSIERCQSWLVTSYEHETYH